MSSDESQITYLARTNFRGKHRLFGIQRRDRRYHLYLVGKTGTGKSTFLHTLIRQDLVNGEGLCLIDPHGDLISEILSRIPESRKADLLVLDPANHAAELGYNPFLGVPPGKRPLAAAGLVDVMKKLWRDSWGPRLEHLLRASFLTLLDQPEATLADTLRLFDETEYRSRAVGRVANAQVRAFWLREFERYSPAMRAEVTAPVRNKVGAFLADQNLARILTARRSVNLRTAMDEGRVLLVNLSKGQLGEGPAALLGALLLAGIAVAGLSRADQPEAARRDFYVYLDEFQSIATLSLVTMLSELRKYRVCLTLAHQYLDQLEPHLYAAVMGNVGTLVTFRVGHADAQVLAREFAPEFTALDLVALPNYSIYLKLMVDGTATRPFSGDTVPI
jgi:type IV secretory pathway TraG/TraD family ATPase VirD4